MVAISTGGARATFDIGSYRTDIPMIPTATVADPRGDRTTWVGRYVVEEGEHLAPTPVLVHVQRESERDPGRTTRRLAGPLVGIGG